MKSQRYALLLCLLSLACAGRGTGAPRSTLLARRCEHALTDPSKAIMTVRVEGPRPIPHDQYLQLTLFALRSGQPDSVIAHVVGRLDSLPPLAAGLYRVQVRAIGYQTAMDSLRVGPGESWCLEARLADAIVLEPSL